ncbi:MAG: peptide chain release factor N(5)-glutamine methyltransferase [Candidatus Omnitrophota bacterium]
MITDLSGVNNTVLDYINWATRYLDSYYVENPRRNAEEIFSFVSNMERIQIYLEGRVKKLDKDIGEKFINLVKKRAEQRYPLQYIKGSTEFYGLKFLVSPGIFIPRLDTEILVDTAIELISLFNNKFLKLLEIGTGSGCISVSLASKLSNIWITATDISTEAIELAKLNALLNGVSGRIEFIQSDLFSGLPSISTYDIIISNPPYIPTFEIEHLQKEISFEPLTALDGGVDGLFYIKKIINQAPQYLSEYGILIMEIGAGQREKIEEMFYKSGFGKIDFIKDYQGIERVVILKK